jgi:hypothetical protein
LPPIRGQSVGCQLNNVNVERLENRAAINSQETKMVRVSKDPSYRFGFQRIADESEQKVALISSKEASEAHHAVPGQEPP